MLLRDVYQAVYGSDAKVNKNNLIDLASILSEATSRELPWTWRYLYSLLKDYPGFTITEDLARALQILANRLDGQSPLQSRVIGEITVLNINGVDPGSIILGHTVRCAYCQVKFVPRVVNGKYCCPEHARLYYNEKRRIYRRR